MSRGDDSENGSDEEESAYQGRTGMKDQKVLNYQNLRATDIPTVQRLIEPKLGTVSQERIMDEKRNFWIVYVYIRKSSVTRKVN